MDSSLALLNSLHWYQAVLSAHGLALEVEHDFWWTAAALPPYYSNFATRTADGGLPAQLDRVRRLAASPPSPHWGIKDSFARLPGDELDGLGFRLLFETQWCGLAPGVHLAGELESDVAIERVETPQALANWERAWQIVSPAKGVRLFPSAILSEPDIEFVVALRAGNLVGGAVANLSEGAVGVSNVFTLPGTSPAPVLRACLRHVRGRHADVPMVGYGGLGPGGDLDVLRRLGFRLLGPLRVWIMESEHSSGRGGSRDEGARR